MIGLRWYLARAKDGYLAETASYSQITTTLSETVEGSRTVEALGLGPKRVELCDDDCAKSFRRRSTRCTCAPSSSRAWS